MRAIDSTEVDLKIVQRILVLCGLCLTLTAVATAVPPSDTGLTTNPAFQKNCAQCHGKNGEGRRFSGPSLVAGKAAKASANEMRTIITRGKGHMPEYADKLSSQEIDTLVQQIQALNKK